MATKIEWCDEVWNPVTGCTPVSAGCDNCYARRMAHRLKGRYGYPSDEPFRVTLHLDKLDEPLHWRKPRRVFVCSMGDLFHKDVPDDFLYRVFSAMRLSEKHTFIVLTKRPRRLHEFMETLSWRSPTRDEHEGGTHGWQAYLGAPGSHPIPNVWLGVSVEDQKAADERIPFLLETPASVRLVSGEPLLGPVDFQRQYGDGASRWCFCGPDRQDLYGGDDRLIRGGIDWIIAGAETGPGARLADVEWFRWARAQCHEASVPFFFKRGSDGSNLLDGCRHNAYPDVKT